MEVIGNKDWIQCDICYRTLLAGRTCTFCFPKCENCFPKSNKHVTCLYCHCTQSVMQGVAITLPGKRERMFELHPIVRQSHRVYERIMKMLRDMRYDKVLVRQVNRIVSRNAIRRPLVAMLSGINGVVNNTLDYCCSVEPYANLRDILVEHVLGIP